MPARHQQKTEYIHKNIRCQFYISIKTGEWEISNINCAQTQPADLTHILDLILLRRLLQKRALEKTSTSAYCNTYVRKKTDLLGVYNVCFLRFLCFLFSLCLQNRCRNQKKCPSHVISRILHSVGFLFGRFQCFGILFGRSFW